MVRIDFSHHVIKLFLEALIDHLVVLLDVLRILLDEDVGDAVDSTSQSLVKERIGGFRDWVIQVVLLLGMNLIRQEGDPADIEVNLLDQRVMNAEIVLVTNLAYHPETAFSVGLIIGGSKRNCICSGQVYGVLFRVYLN